MGQADDRSELRQAKRVFLSAEWRHLLMLNYEVDPALLEKFVPHGTELDSYADKTYVSLVGFQFLRTRLFGFFPVPFHTNFDEINLRFYVRRRVGGTVRRGVVFIREIVPRRAIAALARLVYGEKYVSLPMRHKVQFNAENIETHYEWLGRGKWGGLHAEADGKPNLPAEGSVEQFITEHYWGYAMQPRGACIEYEVKHEPWWVWNCTNISFDGYATDLYGAALAKAVHDKPVSAFLAEGSPVEVFSGKHIARSNASRSGR